jgi:hypothetical protein
VCRLQLGRIDSGKRLERNRREGVGDAQQGLDVAGDEMADIRVVGQVALHQQVELARGGIDLRDLIDVQRGLVGDVIGPAELAFHLHENGLHHTLIRCGGVAKV